ncbi:acyltransferase (plasmid) [Shinella sumterensis]|nr:acyltransferase [Shinella sumterensis]
MKSGNYVIGLDPLRFFAAFAVLCFHLVYTIGLPGSDAYQISQVAVSFNDISAISAYGWIGVQIFFMISGFVIAISAENSTAKRFLAHRFLRLAPTAWICATITLIVLLLMGFGETDSNIQKWLKSILFSPVGEYIDHAYWTLGVEVAFYAIVFAFVAADKWKVFPIFMIAVAAASAIFNIMSLMIGIFPSPDRFSELSMLRFGVFFAMGVGIYRYKQFGSDVVSFSLILIGFMGSLAQIAWNMRYYDGEIDAGKLSILLIFWAVTVLYVVFSAVANESIINIFSAYRGKARILGAFTYPLYLLHQIVGAVLIVRFIELGLGKYTALVLAIVCVSGVTWAVVEIEAKVRVIIEPLVMKAVNKIPLFGAGRREGSA